MVLLSGQNLNYLFSIRHLYRMATRMIQILRMRTDLRKELIFLRVIHINKITDLYHYLKLSSII